MGRKVLIALLAVVVVGGVAAVVYAVANRSKPAPPPPPIVKTPSPSPTPSPRLLQAGEQVTSLQAVGGYGGDGTAMRMVRPNNFKLTVVANVPEPAPGKFLQAWLVRPNPPAQFSVGKLTPKDGSFSVTLQQTRDASQYTTVWVTLESKDDNIPETRVLEGSFLQ